MIFRKEAYFTRDMEDYNRAKAALVDLRVGSGCEGVLLEISV